MICIRFCRSATPQTCGPGEQLATGLAHLLQPVSGPRELKREDRESRWNHDDSRAGQHDHADAEQHHRAAYKRNGTASGPTIGEPQKIWHGKISSTMSVNEEIPRSVPPPRAVARDEACVRRLLSRPASSCGTGTRVSRESTHPQCDVRVRTASP